MISFGEAVSQPSWMSARFVNPLLIDGFRLYYVPGISSGARPFRFIDKEEKLHCFELFESAVRELERLLKS